MQLPVLIKWVWITCLSWRELENDEISSIEHLSAYLSTPPWDILLSLWRTIYKSFRFWKVETVLSISGTFSRPHQQTLWKLVEFLNEWIVRGRNWQVCWHIMEQEIGFFGLLDTATCWIAYKRVGGWIFAAHMQTQDDRESPRLLSFCRCRRIFGVVIFGEWLQLKRRVQVAFLSDPCAHGVRSLGSNVCISVQELFETLWRPSKDCQCCQCCEDLANED